MKLLICRLSVVRLRVEWTNPERRRKTCNNRHSWAGFWAKGNVVSHKSNKTKELGWS
jgi:hypothetical protein